MLKMKLADLTAEILGEIIKIYDETVGGRGQYYVKSPGELEEKLAQVKELGESFCNAVEWRFGSKVTVHSKLWIYRQLIREIPLIYFKFGANASSDYGEDVKLGEKLVKNFEKAVDAFLVKRNLAA